MQAEGLVSEVWAEVHGVVVVADADSADTTLSVRDASDLVNYPNGLLRLPDGSLVAYTGTTASSYDDPDIITLATALGVDLTAEVQLDLVETDVDGDTVAATTYKVTVLFDDGTSDDALIPSHKAVHLGVGIRTPATGERVLCSRADDVDGWLFERVLRRPPKVRPEYLAPGTISVPITFLSDVTLGPMGSIGPMGLPVLTGGATGTIYDRIDDVEIEINAGGRTIDGGLI